MKITKIIIPKTLVNDVIEYSRSCLPQEACWALIGDRIAADNGIAFDRFVPITNIADQPERNFLMDPKEWVQLVYTVVKEGHHMIAGIGHSHPTSEAVPSIDDLQTLWTDMPSYWILSLMDTQKPQLRAYRLMKHSTYEEIAVVQC